MDSPDASSQPHPTKNPTSESVKIVDHQLRLDDSFSPGPIETWFKKCQACGLIVFSGDADCHHNPGDGIIDEEGGGRYQDPNNELPCDYNCHRFTIVHADGATGKYHMRGRDHVVSALGLAWGGRLVQQYNFWSDDFDNEFSTRLQVEVRAAYNAVQRMYYLLEGCERVEALVLTDSEDVIKGVTEWTPKLQSQGSETSDNGTPEDANPFKDLHSMITAVEEEGMSVGFQLIPRELNAVAAILAKEAVANSRQCYR